MTYEMELLAHDPLNPGFGYVLRATVDGEVTQSIELTEAEALSIRLDALGRAYNLSDARCGKVKG